MDTFDNIKSAVDKLPPGAKEDVLAFLMKWLPIIFNLLKADILAISNKLDNKDYRGAFAILLQKAQEIDPYLIKAGTEIEKEFEAMANENAQIQKSLSEGAMLAFKIIATIIIPLLL